MKRSIFSRYLIIILVSVLAAACAKPEDLPPTPDPIQIQTQAVGTFAAGLTQTAAAMPTATPTQTPSPTATETPTPSPTSTISALILPTSSCNALTFVKDITIPDNTKINPGQTFTKTWRVKNSGTCDWEKDYLVKFFSGNAMDGKSVAVSGVVPPGKELDISIAMIAPTKSGVYTGNWRMTDETGAFFGDSFYVMINVAEGTGTAAPTTAATTAPQTSTPTTEPDPTQTPDS